VIGWTVYILANIWLAALGQPGVSMIVFLVFVQTTAYIMSDVMNDAMVVERSKHEPIESRGSFQATGYIARFFGGVIGAVLGAILYNGDSWGWGLTISQIFLLNGLIPLTVAMPFIYSLIEIPPTHLPPSFRAQLLDIWNTAQLRAVWRPMIFVGFYNMMQISNAVWTNFLVDGLDFSEFEIGVISITTAVFSWVGLLSYKRYFFNSSWRGVFVVTTAINLVFSLLQLLLIFRINTLIGMPDILFATGDDAISQFILAIQFLPVCIMYIGLCPAGSEGVMYAMLTSYSNLAYECGYNIGTLLTSVWDVSNSTLEAGDFGGVWRLTLLTSCVQVVPLIFVGVLPANKVEQRKLQESNEKSVTGGIIFLMLFLTAMLWTLIESILEI
jgi:MFS family permease